jgi:ribosomal protein S27AE
MFVQQHGRVTKTQAAIFALHLEHTRKNLFAVFYESVVGAADFCSKCGELIFERGTLLHESQHECIELKNRPKGRIEPADFCATCGQVAILEHACKGTPSWLAAAATASVKEK